MRVFAAMLCLAIAAAGASSVAAGCKDDSESASSGVDPGPTYGAEVTVRVVGRGRVTTQPSNVTCPGECFTRVLFEPGSLDAMVGGVSLGAEPGIGAHFVKWTFEAIPLGIRVAGPEQCSPMTRTSTIPAINETALALTLPFGEMKAVPPVGRESECAAYASSPLAYAVTATFADNSADSGSADASADILFATPASGVEAREIGIVDGRLYWRFQTLGDVRSGIASGPTSGTTDGGLPTVLVPATEIINLFDVDASVVFQYQRTLQPTLHVIRSSSFGAASLPNAPVCDAVASHASAVFCRFSNGQQIYQWPTSNPFAQFLYQVSPGFDLAVDDSLLYFSEQNGGGVEAALIRSGWRSSGTPPGGFSLHVIQQTTPRDLRVGTSYLFWLDGVTAGTRSARAALKSGTSQTAGITVQGARLIAPDPSSGEDVFWAGVYTSGEGFSIVRAAAGSPDAPRIFRTGLPTLGGLAVDATNLYWTQGDGAIRRAVKPF